ncbi:EAL domain-containing protein [Raoultibacter timonensis]|uniref:EAL domain-containing protein n=1 Tax=Raoultibacter timonensis TaxID=1907662 RepID=UPI0011AF3106|nr:EAL domain-containing protein [Raoultibacter timonensis]
MAEITAPDGRQRWNAYVVDSHHRLVYLDQNTMKTMPEARLGDRCYEVVRGESAPCPDCPWRSKNDDRLGRSVLYNHHKHAWFEATCIDIDWPDHGPCMLMASREIDESDKNLLLELDGSSAYDELIEIDVVRRTFRVLYHEPGKYVMPSMGGAFSDDERDARLSAIHEEDRDRYRALWSYESLVRVLERGAKVSGGEFRTLKEDGTWSWVSHSIVPLIGEEREDPSLLCFITDVQRRKDHEAARVGDDGDLAARDERDSITGLWGARPFLDEVERRIADADRAGGYEMVYIDIEHFKVLNDWYGREVGDRMLRALADRLASFCERHEGSVGYFGSDDFVALLPAGIARDSDLESAIGTIAPDETMDVRFYPAIGVCGVDGSDVPVSAFCDRAMIAMNTVKGTYARRIAWYDRGMGLELEQEPKMLAAIQRALDQREFVLYAQPKCNIRTGRIVGLEALVRWNHPEKGLVGPGEFVPFLEKTGFIVYLDRYVWDMACGLLASWIAEGRHPIPVSVNVSRADVRAIDVADELERIVEHHGIERKLLEVEITESAYAEDECVTHLVDDLQRRGFTVLMDDFGSGYSSLNMLKNIGVDTLKIDMGLLREDADDANRSEGILEAVTSMARLMDMPVIAEGVETVEQVEFLKRIGCDYAQGFYFYRPMPQSEFEALMETEGLIDYRGVLPRVVDDIDLADLVQDGGTASRTILENLLGGMAVYAVYSDRFELMQVNNGYYRVTGCNPVDLGERQTWIYRMIHPDDLPMILDMFDRAERHPIAGAEATFRRYRLSGELGWFHMKAYFLKSEGERRIFYAGISDVTEQKLQEEALLSSQAVLDSVLGITSINEGIDALTEEYRSIASHLFAQTVPCGLIGGYCEDGFPLFYANRQIVEMLGYSTFDEFVAGIDGHVINTIHPDDLAQVIEDIGPTYYEGLYYEAMYRMPRKDGSWFWTVDRGRVLRVEDGRLAIASVCWEIEDVARFRDLLSGLGEAE